MRALVTRPVADAGPLARALESRGFDVIIEPLLDISPIVEATVDLDDVQGILATSANGIRALAAVTERRDLPVWAVGEATEAEALRLGFATTEAAGGDVATLASLVTARVDPTKGMLLHPAGRHVAGDLAGRLASHGFAVRRATLYEALPVDAFSPATVEALTTGSIDLAAFFSPRTAATFVRVAQRAGLEAVCATVRAYTLSAAVAGQLEPLAWRAIRVAGQPTQESLLAVIDADAASPRATN
jgi:uroporphyrinogen-III synthase